MNFFTTTAGQFSVAKNELQYPTIQKLSSSRTAKIDILTQKIQSIDVENIRFDILWMNYNENQ